jgi:hypothetical protein
MCGGAGVCFGNSSGVVIHRMVMCPGVFVAGMLLTCFKHEGWWLAMKLD